MTVLIWPTTPKLTNYTNSDYIPIMDGSVIIWRDFDYLRHSSNLTRYAEIAEETTRLTDHFPLSHMKRLMVPDVQHIVNLLASLNVHHRHARSINVLGTALKVIAGTPDFDDFENLKFKQQELINAENTQIAINTKTQDQINRLTDAVNNIIRESGKGQIDTGHLYETLLARNRIIISEIETLLLSVTLAKIGIINPLLLDSEDLRKIMYRYSTNTTVTDIMESSYVKVLLDNDFLHFLIKYPRPRIVCKKIILFPVQHNEKVLHFDENTVADCENEILAIGHCTATLTSTFCRELPHPSCAQQVHSGRLAHCTTRPSHLEPVVVVDDGIIIVNDNTARVRTTENTKTITGTFLITFEGEIQINGTTYENTKGLPFKIPGSAAITSINITGHEELLSLPYLKRLSVENLRIIGNIKNTLIAGPATFTLIMVAAVIVYCFAKLRRRRERDLQSCAIQAAIDSFGRSEDGSRLSEGGVNTLQLTP